MKKILFALLLALVLSASSNDAMPGPEVLPTMDRSSIPQQVTVVVHSDLADLNRAYDEYAGVDMPEVYGWTTWYLAPGKLCEIHVTKPAYLHTRPVETWGHELMHCIYGSYHPE